MDLKLLKQYLTGNVEGFVIDESFLLYAGILMELPMAMILLSKILAKKADCWANIIEGSIINVTKYYYFFAAIEIITTIFIIDYATQWLRDREFRIALVKATNL